MEISWLIFAQHYLINIIIIFTIIITLLHENLATLKFSETWRIKVFKIFTTTIEQFCDEIININNFI